jgi:Zn finger protein HypA/HybF involved in hydrogenase expression
MDAKEELRKTAITEPVKVLIGGLMAGLLLPALALIPRIESQIARILTFRQLLLIAALELAAMIGLSSYLFYLIRSFQNWRVESAKYILTEIAKGVFVYALKAEELKTSPNHWLCAHCFEGKHKSILQRGKRTEDGTIYSCPNCKNKILDNNDCSTPPMVLPEFGRW